MASQSTTVLKTNASTTTSQGLSSARVLGRNAPYERLLYPSAPVLEMHNTRLYGQYMLEQSIYIIVLSESYISPPSFRCPTASWCFSGVLVFRAKSRRTAPSVRTVAVSERTGPRNARYSIVGSIYVRTKYIYHCFERIQIPP